MLGLWPLLALGILIFAVWEVVRHIHTEQEGILLQATDPRVESPKGSSPLPTSGAAPGIESQMCRDPCPDALSWVLGHRCVHCVHPSPGPSHVYLSFLSRQ